MASSSNELSFMALPAELRMEIITFALVYDEPLKMEAYHDAKPAKKRNNIHAYPSPPPLSQANQEFRRQAIPIFYGLNTFTNGRLGLRLHGTTDQVQDGQRTDFFRWRVGLIRYGIDARKLVEKLQVQVQGQRVDFTRERDGNIIITVRIAELAKDLAAGGKMRAVCVCRYEAVVARVIANNDMRGGEVQLLLTAQSFSGISNAYPLLKFSRHVKCYTCRGVDNEPGFPTITRRCRGAVVELELSG